MPATPSGGVLRYPYEALTEKTDYLQITIFSYDTTPYAGTKSLITANNTNKNPYSSQGFASGVSKAKVLGNDGVIILPMPSNIQDSNAVSYEAGSMNQITAAGIKAFNQATAVVNQAGGNIDLTGTITKGGEQIFAAGAGFVKESLNGDTRELIIKALSAQAVNIFGANVDVNQILARSGGKIINPNMELLFNNVTLRTFRFSFKMTPRDDREATSIKSIIRSLKKNMAAKSLGDSSANGLFLNTPNIFELQYKKGNRPHPFLNLFKPCFLSDMSVNYTGENVYATYSDGTPLSLSLNLTFKEILPIYEEDYKNKANFDKQSKDEVNGADLIYGITGNTQNDNVQGVGF